ncbi:MAG: hypothetical protein R3292_13860 [Alcanivorax sp.]|nr:hypothetical protein [Alcanivorax sp.]
MDVRSGLRWLSAALLVLLWGQAWAQLIDSERVGSNAYLLSSNQKLFIYSQTTNSVTSIDLSGSGSAPVALDVEGSNVYIAFQDHIEKHDLSGALVNNGTRNYPDVSDIAALGSKVYVSFNGGDKIAQLNAADLSLTSFGASGVVSLAAPMKRLANNQSTTSTVFYSPDKKDILALAWPPVLTKNADGSIDPVSPVTSKMNKFDTGFLADADNLYVLNNGYVVLNNGAYWSIDPSDQTVLTYQRWIDGQTVTSLDQTDDGQFSVIRPQAAACESSQDLLAWNTDLVHYQANMGFKSRTKARSPDNGAVNYEIVHLWGDDAYLFYEFNGGVAVDIHARSEGKPFNDGNTPLVVAPGAVLQDSAVDSRLFAVDDDARNAYFLYRGAGRCAAALQVYSLSQQQWTQSIPLRWKPDAIAMVSGDLPDSSDDKLALIYDSVFDGYGGRHPAVTFMDINAATLHEDAAADLPYDIRFSRIGEVRGLHHAVLFQVEHSGGASVLMAKGPNGESAQYVDTETGSGSLDEGRPIDFWGETDGANSVIAVMVGNALRLVNFQDSAGAFSIQNAASNEVAVNIKPSEPLFISPDLEWIISGAESDTNQAALFQQSVSFGNGEPVDYLGTELGVATWSRTLQGSDPHYALYNAIGGASSDSQPYIQRWQLKLGSDNHLEFSNAYKAELSGEPVFLKVIDPDSDTLLLATREDNTIHFSAYAKDLNSSVDIGNSGGGTAGQSSGGGGSRGGISLQGSSSSGGGSALLVAPFLVLLMRRRR